jgi:hypothetical protein
VIRLQTTEEINLNRCGSGTSYRKAAWRKLPHTPSKRPLACRQIWDRDRVGDTEIIVAGERFALGGYGSDAGALGATNAGAACCLASRQTRSE